MTEDNRVEIHMKATTMFMVFILGSLLWAGIGVALYHFSNKTTNINFITSEADKPVIEKMFRGTHGR